MNRRLGHAAKTYTRNTHRRNRRVRGTEGPHRLPDCRDPKHIGRWPHTSNRSDRNRKTSQEVQCRHSSENGRSATGQICEAQARLRADASCDRKTKAENERQRPETYRRSAEETMGDQEGRCLRSGVESVYTNYPWHSEPCSTATTTRSPSLRLYCSRSLTSVAISMIVFG